MAAKKNKYGSGLRGFAAAMRYGAKIRPQVFGGLFNKFEDGEEIKSKDGKGGSCALGAVMEAVNGKPKGLTLYKLFPVIEDSVIQFDDSDVSVSFTCPACAKDPFGYQGAQDVENLTIHLNDSHKWTRERIAAYWEAQAAKVERLSAKEAARMERAFKVKLQQDLKNLKAQVA